jgi:hypothetical protein
VTAAALASTPASVLPLEAALPGGNDLQITVSHGQLSASIYAGSTAQLVAMVWAQTSRVEMHLAAPAPCLYVGEAAIELMPEAGARVHAWLVEQEVLA